MAFIKLVFILHYLSKQRLSYVFLYWSNKCVIKSILFIGFLGQGWSRCQGIFCMVITRQLWVGSRLYQAFWFGLCWLQERALSAPKVFCLLVLAVLERWREKWQERLTDLCQSSINFWSICKNLFVLIKSVCDWVFSHKGL